MTLVYMKKIFKKQLKMLVKSDAENLYDSLDRDMVAMGIHPNAVSITAEYQTLMDDYQTALASINSASTKVEFKTIVKNILNSRTDGQEYKRMFGSGEIIN